MGRIQKDRSQAEYQTAQPRHRPQPAPRRSIVRSQEPDRQAGAAHQAGNPQLSTVNSITPMKVSALNQPDCDSAIRPRILLLAYACSPYRGSEFTVGWGWA